MSEEHKISQTKEFKDFKGTLKLELIEDAPAIRYTAEISPAMLPEGTYGQKISTTRNYRTISEAELTFAEFKERHTRSWIEYLMFRAEEMRKLEDAEDFAEEDEEFEEVA